ncbi:hypothetical protein BDV26DRAFT_278229 [Aspergillus bertholletiae]|uniref:Myb-like domain-containing protein n=1 Tax=Aspergillus bertholletiae TaxID=1226010 RepID=A0A5N7BKC7_9EURO|nr:hypothetical protein BDV26DRAFT_278229 [Aspergillus bertholletiae]
MVHVHADPDKQEPRLAFVRDLISSNLAPNHSLINNFGGVFPTSLCAPQTGSILYSKEAAASEESQMHRWLEPSSYHSMGPDGIANKSLMAHEAMRNCLSRWPEALTSTSFEESKVQFYDCRVRSSSQIQGPFIQSACEIAIPQTHDQHAQYTAHPGNQERKFGEKVKNGDFVFDIAHPIPGLPISCMTGNSFSSLSGPEPDPVVISPFSTPDNPGEPLFIGDKAQNQEWVVSEVEPPKLFRTLSEKRSVPVINHFNSVSRSSTPPPWSPAGVQTVWDVKQRNTSRDDAFWVDIPCGLRMNGLDSHIEEDFGHAPNVSNDLHSSSPLENTCQSHTQSDMASCQSKLASVSFPIVRERSPDNSVHNLAQSYYDNPCIHHLVYPANRECFLQSQRGNRQIAHYNHYRDAFLVECKRRGLSYKDIKRIGGLKEAESTLRGRFRTLTKSKEQRVRKPQWQEKDISLLCQAVKACVEDDRQACSNHVSSCRPPTSSQPPKVSWKMVAQYIWTHGGSYHFGNATCKKKWCDIHGVKFWNWSPAYNAQKSPSMDT